MVAVSQRTCLPGGTSDRVATAWWPYRSLFPHAALRLPHTTALLGRILVLPTGTSVELEDIDRICDIVEAALTQAESVREALAAHKEE